MTTEVIEDCVYCAKDIVGEKHEVLDGPRAWGGRVMGYECEECAEGRFDDYQEWLAS